MPRVEWICGTPSPLRLIAGAGYLFKICSMTQLRIFAAVSMGVIFRVKVKRFQGSIRDIGTESLLLKDLQFCLGFWIAIIDEVVELGESLVKIEAVANGGSIFVYVVGNMRKMSENTLYIGLRFMGDSPAPGARLDKQDEQMRYILAGIHRECGLRPPVGVQVGPVCGTGHSKLVASSSISLVTRFFKSCDSREACLCVFSSVHPADCRPQVRGCHVQEIGHGRKVDSSRRPNISSNRTQG
jgi:hypothetical protein